MCKVKAKAMGQPRFTIIIPACEVAPYVGEAIASLKRQSWEDYEVLVTVETSEDGTEEACRAAMAGDARFRLVNLPRSGSAAQGRNVGMQQARGDYVLFIDGDDWIEDEALARFDEILRQRPELDIIVSGMNYRMQEADGTTRYLSHDVQGEPGSYHERGIDFMRAVDFTHRWCPSACMFVFRQSLLRRVGLLQPHGRIHEDLAWSYRVVMEAGAVYVAPFCYYNYRQRQGSVTNDVSAKSIHDRTSNAQEILAYWGSDEVPSELRGELARFYCWQFLHTPFFLRKFTGVLVKGCRQRRADCTEALQAIFSRPGAFGTYCSLCVAAGECWFLFVPLMWLARWRWFYPVAEYAFRIWHNRLLPLWRRLHR